MTIIGYRKGANSINAIQSIRKHTGLSLKASKQLVEQVLAGEIVKLDDDFILREELIDFRFIVR